MLVSPSSTLEIWNQFSQSVWLLFLGLKMLYDQYFKRVVPITLSASQRILGILSISPCKTMVSAYEQSSRKPGGPTSCKEASEDYKSLVSNRSIFLKPTATLLYTHLNWQQQPCLISLSSKHLK
jgi:hypothetical protein